MHIKSQKDFWSGLMFVAVGVGFAWGATEYSFGSSARPGPGYFPFGLGVLLAILGGMVLFKALTIETSDGEPVGAFAWRPLFIILGAVALFGLMLPRAGMLISLPVLVVLSSLASDEFSWKGSIINAVVLTALSWVVFIKGLSLTIPLLPGA
ncbi:tripartite tricarboxylate transporter TctB family protein [Ideonella sp. 4Y16]|uniref:Tripartite tricarboxylate transporter TctB family protein n=1 Tax=Ideonella alba TaxID=2824118 RepID=A0A941BEH8_9BURK|nr:tripartite tricarboxylate transporter TctB family protein [Ideonella alba]MBQ0929987.1 tripartite tricarboxylate transporter TctB family protein [Ideonella alba]MBQ0945999.1 tripartite tricarboxylate transporter TctB family protein [Ideonella alba]